MSEHHHTEWTLSTNDLAQLQEKAFNLGVTYALQAITDAGYNTQKRQRVREHLAHEGNALNEHLAAVLLLTAQGRSLLPRPHAE